MRKAFAILFANVDVADDYHQSLGQNFHKDLVAFIRMPSVTSQYRLCIVAWRLHVDFLDLIKKSYFFDIYSKSGTVKF